MQQNENFRRVVKIFIVTFLCSELQSNSLLQKSKSSPKTWTAAASELNGTYAPPGTTKYHASIRLTALDKNFGEGHICSGVLVAPSVVLTAAQCVFNYKQHSRYHPSELRVIMGTQNRYQRMEHTLDYAVTHLYTPPDFDAQTLRDNIAILMLARDIPDNEHVQPITIKMDQPNTETLKSLKSTTWATTKKGQPLMSLMLLNADFANEFVCQRSYGEMLMEGVHCIHFVDVAQSPCPSDAGAPLLYDEELIGIASLGNDCGSENLPAIYSDVRHYRQWILTQIGDGTNQNSSIWGTLGFLGFTILALKAGNLKKRQLRLEYF